MPSRIDPYSAAAVPLQQYFNNTLHGQATGFVWQGRDKLYLITNWHVVSGRNNETGACIHPKGREPNKLVALFRLRKDIIETSSVEIPLFDADGAPLWLHHPSYKRKVDVVAIPLQNAPNDDWAAQPINLLPRRNELSVQIGMDIFVLGYPFGSSPPSLPVWKRGSMASEPQLIRLGEKFYLIDSASRPGMSGAPAILRTYGAHLTESGTSITTEPATKFIGIYSGRLQTKDADDAQIGRVWPESFIIEIIDANARDDGSRD